MTTALGLMVKQVVSFKKVIFIIYVFDTLCNGSKSKLFYYKGRSSNVMQSGITVKGAVVYLSGKAVHLDHTISLDDRECITLAAKNRLWKSYNILLPKFGHLYSFIETAYLFPFTVDFMGHHCGIVVS